MLADLVITIPPLLDNQRLDIALTQLTDMSRNHIQQLINLKGVKVNKNIIVSRSFKIKKDDICELNMNVCKRSELICESNTNVNVIFENDDLAVINKPAGQIVHAAGPHQTNTLSDQLFNHFKGQLSTFSHRPGIIHRLDKDTSGLMIIAKNDKAHNHIQQQFEKRIVQKIYIAGIENTSTLPAHFLLTGYITQGKNKLMVCTRNNMHILERSPEPFDVLCKANTIELVQAVSQESCKNTILKPNQSYGKYVSMECIKNDNKTLICIPHTGRQHQIRSQLKSIQHPIKNDKLYNQLSSGAMQLHAFGLEFFDLSLNKLKIYSALPNWLTETSSM